MTSSDLERLYATVRDVPTAIKMLKLQEECGEVAGAYIGVTGANPRKGVTHDEDDVILELADVALSALVAMRDLHPDPFLMLSGRLAEVADRAEGKR